MRGMNDERIAQTVARAQAIRWDQPDRDAREGSQIALMFELLRRMALWADALRCAEEWPFFSVVEQMARGSSLARSILAQPALASIEEAFDGWPSYPRRICSWFVQWSAIEGTGEVHAFGLPAPYEPAILMFERGGLFHIENRMFQFGLPSFPVGTLARSLGKTALALDEATLAREDERRREVEHIERRKART